jgi:hypothetical protein
VRVELTEVIWLEEQVLSFAELAELSDLPQGLLEELVQSGAIVPIDDDVDHETHYGAEALAAARHARQLHEDFELDAAALVLVLGLCDRVSELEARLRELQAKLPRRPR